MNGVGEGDTVFSTHHKGQTAKAKRPQTENTEKRTARFDPEQVGSLQAATRFSQMINLEQLQVKFDLQNKRLAGIARTCVDTQTLADRCAEILQDEKITRMYDLQLQQTLDVLIDNRAIEHSELPTLSLSN